VSQADAVSATPAAELPATPLTDWTLRPFAASPRAPLAIGLGYALAMIGISWVFRIAVGDWQTGFGRSPYFWLDILNGMLFAYVPTATWMLRSGRLRDLRELRSVLRCDDAEFELLAQRAVCVPPRRLLVSALIGAVAMGAMPVLDLRFWEGPPPPLTDPEMIFFIARNVAMGILVGHTVLTEWNAVTVFSEIGAARVEIDLFDLRRLSVFPRAGLRGAFAWVLCSSLISLFWLGPAAGSANGGILFAILTLVSVGIYFTILGVHQSIREAKREALDEVADGIRQAGAALRSGAQRSDSPALADLVAYHGFLERLSEWPLGVTSLVRGALIAALGIGSWLGGALVERMIDSFF
jgi:hypothetical protein